MLLLPLVRSGEAARELLVERSWYLLVLWHPVPKSAVYIPGYRSNWMLPTCGIVYTILSAMKLYCLYKRTHKKQCLSRYGKWSTWLTYGTSDKNTIHNYTTSYHTRVFDLFAQSSTVFLTLSNGHYLVTWMVPIYKRVTDSSDKQLKTKIQISVDCITKLDNQISLFRFYLEQIQKCSGLYGFV